MKYYLLLLSCLCSFDLGAKNHASRLADVEVQFGPFMYYDDDDDDFLYDDDFYNQTGVNVWIGPGLYYGVWFDSEYQYRYWARRNYYYSRGWRNYRRGYYHNHGHRRHGDGRHGGSSRHGGGGHGGGRH